MGINQFNNIIHTTNGNVKAGVIKSQFEQAQKRITEGVNSGQLTQEEADSLKAQMQSNFDDLTAFKGDDGKVSSDERIYTREEMNQLKKEIYTAKHN